MTHMPVIGLTVNGRPDLPGIDCRQAYYQRLAAAGALPMLLPPLPEQIAAYAAKIDGLLLSGGGDVDAHWFGQAASPLAHAADWQRDAWEIGLCRALWRQGKPILGICRGMQVLNIALGGDIWQDLSLRPQPCLVHDQSCPRQQTSHLVEICQADLAAVLGRHYAVNSLHHQAVRRIAPDLLPAAYASDGICEALWAKDGQRFALGLQWHPEYLPEDAPFQWLTAAAAEASH